MLRFTQNNRRRAFTLVELLIVVIIIAVLAAVAIPRFADSGKRSKEAASQANLKLIKNAIQSFKGDTGQYPADLGDLADAQLADVKMLDNTTPQAKDWKGPYLEEVPQNPTEPDGATNNKNWTYTAATGTVAP